MSCHAPRMPGTFSPPPVSQETASYRSRHASRHVRHARAVMHVGIADLRWHGKRSRHSRRMLNVSGKRPIKKRQMLQWDHTVGHITDFRYYTIILHTAQQYYGCLFLQAWNYWRTMAIFLELFEEKWLRDIESALNLPLHGTYQTISRLDCGHVQGINWPCQHLQIKKNIPSYSHLVRSHKPMLVYIMVL